MEPFILASTSPRRQDILRQMGIPFSVVASDVDETPDPSHSIPETVVSLARKKVKSALKTGADRSWPWVLGADTLLGLNGKIMGKPRDEDDARDILRSLSGTVHDVFTGIAVYKAATDEMFTAVSASRVSFKSLSEREQEWYVNTGEWQGVAGGYRIQGRAAMFITRIEGSYSSIAGLPISDFYAIIRDAGYEFD